MAAAVMPISAEYSRAARRILHRARAQWRPPPRLSTVDWAEKYRRLSAMGSVNGAFRFDLTPYLRGILAAFDDPSIHTLVCQKSAQIGWTDGVLMNVLGKCIHQDPCPIIVLFPKDGTAKAFTREKINPTIEATPVLLERVDTRSRGSDNTLEFKRFDGGFLKLCGTNSPANVKSTPARIVAVEEPDDTNRDVKGQGSAIALGKERNKTYWNRKTLIGGTPTIKDFSDIETEMAVSDRRRFFVPCHACGHAAPLSWQHVTWLEDSPLAHPVYGQHRPETARYACPGCEVLWTDAEKNENVLRAEAAGHGWKATAPCNGVAGFYLNELYSRMPASRLSLLVEKWLEAQHAKKRGDNGPLKIFVNSTLGELWEIKRDLPPTEQLAERALAYPEWCCPAGGLLLTMGVDVQHDRLALVARAWGRGEESWLVYWGELPGNPLEPAVWADLDRLLSRPVRNIGGGVLHLSACSIDASDGQTADAVYAYVRSRRGRRFMAVKGSSRAGHEIYRAPSASVDVNHRGKAARHGVRLYMVGVHRAKDLIDGRLKLEGDGEGRLHWYVGVRDDYLDQLTSEVKLPSRGGQSAWKCKSGHRNEALDCEVYAMHAARRLRVHTMSEAEWVQIEASVRQHALPLDAADDAALPEPVAVDEPKRPVARTQPRAPDPAPGGSGDWSW
jgi:phage terminase large subunit GpA-like protein